LDVDVLERDLCPGEVEFGDPAHLIADLSLGAESGPAKTGRVVDGAVDHLVAGALPDEGSASMFDSAA